jgi:hypothetical protein
VDPSYPRLALGQTDGVVRFFDLASLPACSSLHILDLGRDVQQLVGYALTGLAAAEQAGLERRGNGPRVVQSNGKQQQQQCKGSTGSAAGWQQASGANGDGYGDSGDFRVVSNSIASLYYSRLIPTMTPSVGQADTLVEEHVDGRSAAGLLAPQPLLLVGTPRGLMVVNSHSYEVVQVWLVGEDAERCRDIER